MFGGFLSKVLINFISSALKSGSRSKTLKNFSTKMNAAVSEPVISMSGKLSSDTVKISGKTFSFAAEEIKMTDELIKRTTKKQRLVLEDLYRKYIVLSKNKVKHPVSDIIQEGSLLHSQRFNADTFKATLKDGLVSGDIGSSLRQANGEQRTIGGLDTWVNDKTRTIKQYFHEWLATPPEHGINKITGSIRNREFNWRGENTWMDLANGGKKQKNIAFVISPVKHKELENFMQYKVTQNNKNSPTTFFGGSMTKGMYETENFARHTFIPVGIPSPYIEKIIVGDKITESEITFIKSAAAELGLDLKVYNTLGMKL